VRRERTALTMTQERLAELTDLHLRTIQKIEAGDINVPSVCTRHLVALGRA
jgi:transcriptional regulator with XRE-family HTH domain